MGAGARRPQGPISKFGEAGLATRGDCVSQCPALLFPTCLVNVRDTAFINAGMIRPGTPRSGRCRPCGPNPVRLDSCLDMLVRPEFSGGDMTEAVLAIKQWGNNLGVRLPAAVAREARLHADQRVRVSVEGGQVVIRPVTDVDLTLEQRLARFDPARHGGEVMSAGQALGAEHW